MTKRTPSFKKLTSNQKKNIREDFLTWAGYAKDGHPESADQINNYVSYACPIDLDETLVYTFIREWAATNGVCLN